MSLDLSALTQADFTPLVGTDFTVQLNEAEMLTLTLVEARAVGAPFRPGARWPFALTWQHPHLPHGAYLPQRIYTLHHPALGALDVFMTPLGPQAEGMRYEAVFN